MSALRSPLWGIVLAGEAEIRPKKFLRGHAGTEATRQFLRLHRPSNHAGERAVRPARLLIPSKRLMGGSST
jgi:hypothetical protein